jgi:hypothetical protein
VIRSVNLSGGNQPPTAAGTCAWTADTWTMQVTDNSFDPNDANLDNLQVIVDWGDLGAKSAVPRLARPQIVTKVYNRPGTFPVTAKALDIQGLSSTYTCPQPATPTYFAITGAVTTGQGSPISGARVTLARGSVAIASKLTAVDGTYAFPDLKPGTYAISVTKTGYGFGAAPQHPALIVGPSKVADVTAVTVPTGAVSPGKVPAVAPLHSAPKLGTR